MSDLFNSIMEEKEKKESEILKEVEDPNNPITWANETMASYIIWLFQKKSDADVEKIMDDVLERLKA